MDEAKLRNVLESAADPLSGKAVASRLSKARKAEGILDSDLDEAMSGDKTPSALVFLRDVEQERSGNLPIVYAPDASGVLRHIDDVPNGKACGCRCPAAGCGQPLVAKNGGRVRIHHFAHERGTCAWAAESVIAALAERVLGRTGRAAFPRLAFEDAFEGCEVELSPARTLPVVAASTEFVTGRGAPEVVVTCRSAAGDEKRFAFVFCLVHPLEERHIAAFRAAMRCARFTSAGRAISRKRSVSGTSTG